MTRETLLALADKLDSATTGGKLRFSLCMGEGWVTTGRESTIRLLCDIWNARHEIAAALRARAAS